MNQLRIFSLNLVSCCKLGFGVVLVASTLVQGCSSPSEKAHNQHASPSSLVSYGSVMADIGRRFELLGRASLSGRYELAQYHLGEISEQFDEVLPLAAVPHEGHPEVLPKLAATFAKNELAALQQQIEKKDKAAIVTAFEKTANACNACHKASGHGFIEIPTQPGSPVPRLDPVIPLHSYARAPNSPRPIGASSVCGTAR